MEKKFLEEIAERLILKHHTHFSDVVVVLPANRAKLFLKKHLGEKLQATCWLPRIVVFPELVEWLGNKKTSSNLHLLLQLYASYCKIIKNPEPFERYMSWAPTVLNDFNDIKQYLIDEKSLFINLRNIDYIDQWSLNAEHLSISQERYVTFWEDLGKTFNALKSDPVFQNSYANAIHRLVNDADQLHKKCSGNVFWFVGMANFTPAEELLVHQIGSISKTHIEWDMDHYYISDEMNKAGAFMRKYASKNKLKITASDHFKELPKTLTSFECSSSAGEVFALANCLMEMTAEELNDAAILVADDTLIQPLISALPLLPVPINLALGLPLSSQNCARWVSLLLKLKQEEEKGHLLKNDVLEWMHCAFDFGVDSTVVTAVHSHIAKNSWNRVTTYQLDLLLGMHDATACWRSLFQAPLDSAFVQQVIAIIEQHIQSDKKQVFTTAAIQVIRCLEELHSTFGAFPFTQNIASVIALWQYLIKNEKIQFQGEPVNGLQILSPIETRALDFSTVMIIGANDDTLSGGGQMHTFIPWDIRYELGLPLPDEQENTYAYTLYRALQRSSSIHFYHSLISSDFKGTERSRFIQQLENELHLVNPAVRWIKRQPVFKNNKAGKLEQKMPNDAFAHGRLDQLFAAGISPSAIGKFLRCPLDFYYRYILGLGEVEVIEERISASAFGSVIHDALEQFYLPYVKQYPNRVDFQDQLKKCEQQLVSTFARLFAANNIQTGYNALAFAIAKEMLERYFNFEKGRLTELEQQGIRPTLVAVEHSLFRSIDTAHLGVINKPIALRGKADRIDIVAGKHVIIDYKTGSVKPADYDLKKGDINSLFQKAESGKIIQLLAYIYMLNGEGVVADNIQAAFYSFKNHGNGYLQLAHEGKTGGEVVAEFEAAVVTWVDSIYAMSHFEHNSESLHCQYCGH